MVSNTNTVVEQQTEEQLLKSINALDKYAQTIHNNNLMISFTICNQNTHSLSLIIKPKITFASKNKPYLQTSRYIFIILVEELRK